MDRGSRKRMEKRRKKRCAANETKMSEHKEQKRSEYTTVSPEKGARVNRGTAGEYRVRKG
jgi:hypothetical protein